MASTERWSNLLVPLIQSTASQWILIFSLIFGGCCSNAWALELTTRENPHSGTLITFAQYLIVVLTNARKHVIWTPAMPDRPTRAQVVAYVVRHAEQELRRGSGGVVVVEGGEPEERAKWRRELEGESTRKDGERSLTVVARDELSQGEPPSSQDCLLKVVLLNNDSDVQLTTLSLSTTPTITLSLSYPTRPKILSTTHLSTTSPPTPTPTFLTRLPKVTLRRPRIPFKVWLIQVALFFAVSLLNNLALGFNVNLAVHIIFRSGGLAANLLVGWLVKGKRYSRAQVGAVVLVTLGVACSTLSSKAGKSRKGGGDGDYHTTSLSGKSYAIGIALLTIALLLSAGMGLAQEDAYAKYGRHWEEGLFFLHFLGMPMFAFVGKDLVSQFRVANASPPVQLSAVSLLGLPANTQPNVNSEPADTLAFDIPIAPLPLVPPTYPHWAYSYLEKGITWADAVLPSITIPRFWVPLGLNILTQLICVSGVHRLTSRVSSLTVTLILVVRKAVSLGISVLLIQGSTGNKWLWGGAAAVLLGTVMYSVDGARAKKRRGLVVDESRKRK